jgi:hypothetical protein
MTILHVLITHHDIACATPAKSPLDLAARRAFGSGWDVECGDAGLVATRPSTGGASFALKADYPHTLADWIGRWRRGEAVDPALFSLELDSAKPHSAIT